MADCPDVPYKRRDRRQVFVLVPVGLYTSQVQQPRHARATLRDIRSMPRTGQSIGVMLPNGLTPRLPYRPNWSDEW